MKYYIQEIEEGCEEITADDPDFRDYIHEVESEFLPHLYEDVASEFLEKQDRTDWTDHDYEGRIWFFVVYDEHMTRIGKAKAYPQVAVNFYGYQVTE